MDRLATSGRQAPSHPPDLHAYFAQTAIFQLGCDKVCRALSRDRL
jgi:hypothetical protein